MLKVLVDDTSYRYRAIKGDNSLTLYYSLPQHVEIPVGSTCEFQGETYTLMRPESFTMRHTRLFEYTVTFDSDAAKLKLFKLRNPVDRRLKFSYTATPAEHLQMIVDNMNMRDSGWTAGECISSPAQVITFSHMYCHDALNQIAETFDTEYEVSGKKISLKKIEYNRGNPLSLAYGKGKGFRPGVGRTNFEDSLPVNVLYVQGGSRNIDASKYGNSELLLPKNATIRYDGQYFEDEPGFNAAICRTYITDADGYSITRQGGAGMAGQDDSLECSEIYPHRDEKILKVIIADADKSWYDVVTDTPESLDYSQYGIGGETPTIVFQDGMLAGREFDLETDDDGNIICEKYYEDNIFVGWKFQIVPAEIDGMTMPGGVFVPEEDDVFRMFGIALPLAYISEDATKSGASWEMFRQGVKYLYDHEDMRFTFTGELDGIWSKKDWLNIGGKIKLGGYVSFTNEQFQPEPVLIRITGIKDYINNPYSPEIELSNSTVGGSVSGELNKINNNQAASEEMYRNSLSFTKRRFRDTKETMQMLQQALLSGFTDEISPITVQTMQMLIGDESLQFRFVDSTTDPVPVSHDVYFDIDTKILEVDGGIIQHMTLGINSVSTTSGHSSSEYKFWSLPSFESPVLSDPQKKYYIYARVEKDGDSGTFRMSESAIAMDSDPAYYHLLLGLLNSEYDGERSYVSLYGFTEILPGQVSTDILRDPDGNLVIDLSKALITAKNGARINGNLTVGPGSEGLENFEEWNDKEAAIENAITTAGQAADAAQAAESTAQEAMDAIGALTQDGFITPLEKQALKNELARIQADYKDVQSGYSKYGLGDPADYNAAYTNYRSQLYTLTASSPENIPVPSDFDSTQQTYYDEWTEALDVIAAAAKQVADNAQDAAQTAQSIAEQAANDAQQAQDRLDSWASDGYISPTEKPALKDEIARIDSDYDYINGSYTKYSLGTPTSYNNIYSTYRNQLIDLSASTPENISIPSTFRTNQTDYYARRSDAMYAIAGAAKDMVSSVEGAINDIEYLKSVFPNSTLVAGATISEMAVVESENNVVAGLNGTTTGNDSTHGKVMIFSGAPSSGSLAQKIRTANTRIYEDGHLVTNSADIEGKITATSGSIGHFTIQDYWLSGVASDTGVSINLSPSAFGLKNEGYKSYQTSISVGLYYTDLQGTDDNNLMTMRSQREGLGTICNVRNTLLYLRAIGAKDGWHEESYPYEYRYDGNYAIRCSAGMFAGLRPMTRLIPSRSSLVLLDKEAYLTVEDSIIICRGANAALTLYLPNGTSMAEEAEEIKYYRQNGQLYTIIRHDSMKLTIDGNGARVNWSGVSTATTQTLSSDNFDVVHLLWSSELSRWEMWTTPNH